MSSISRYYREHLTMKFKQSYPLFYFSLELQHLNLPFKPPSILETYWKHIGNTLMDLSSISILKSEINEKCSFAPLYLVNEQIFVFIRSHRIFEICDEIKWTKITNNTSSALRSTGNYVSIHATYYY